MHQKQFHQYVSQSTGNECNICQIYVIKDGKTVFEDNWNGFAAGDAANINSVTKSVMALLAGIAIDRGFIQDVDQRVLDFFPDYAVRRGEKTIQNVTLKHLLTMTAPYKYRSEPWTRVCTSNDWTKAALDLLGGRRGITGEFKYATLGIQILTGIIEHASGMSCIDFANEFLFQPLGIPRVALHGDSSKEDQFDYLMNRKPRRYEWYNDPQGSVTAGWGLCLSARDLAVIGQLVLNEGIHDGKQIVSKAYLSDMTRPHVKLNERFGNMSYGYLWYQPHEGQRAAAAIGDGGNIIYADPARRISVGITGTFRPAIYDRVEFIENTLLKVIDS